MNSYNKKRFFRFNSININFLRMVDFLQIILIYNHIDF
jgi:hypothetical protein